MFISFRVENESSQTRLSSIR